MDNGIIQHSRNRQEMYSHTDTIMSQIFILIIYSCFVYSAYGIILFSVNIKRHGANFENVTNLLINSYIAFLASVWVIYLCLRYRKLNRQSSENQTASIV